MSKKIKKAKNATSWEDVRSLTPEVAKTQLSSLKESQDRLNENITAVGMSLLKEQFMKLFGRFPAMTEFEWDQHTPFYCDGEPCSFWAVISSVNGKEAYDWNSSDPVTKWMDRAAEAIVSFLDRNTKMLEMFLGDHKHVKVDRNGITVKTDRGHD